MQKLESSQEYLETDGLYRVPGDAAKVQKIRVEVDQVSYSCRFRNSHCYSRYRICCPLCCFLDSHFVVSVTPFAVSVAHFVEMCPHFVDSVTHFVVSDQQNGNVFFQNVMCRPEC